MSMRLLIVAFLIGLILAASPALPAQAEGGVWATHGPSSVILALAVEPGNEQIVYAAGPGGLWKTDTAGASWVAVNTQIPFGHHLVIDPLTPTTLYATGNADRNQFGDDTILKSSDGGISWTTVFSATGSIQDLKLDPNRANTLYVAHRSLYLAQPGANAQVSRSLDGGATWTPVVLSNAMASENVGTSLTMLPGVPDLLYVGLAYYHGNAFLKTTSASSTPTWTTIPTASPLHYGSYTTIAVGGNASNHLLYSVYTAMESSTLVYSENDAPLEVLTTTTMFGSNTFHAITALSINMVQPNWIYAAIQTTNPNHRPNFHSQAGVFTSLDRGQTWIALGELDKPVHDLKLATHAHTLYAATDEGVYQYTIRYPVAQSFQPYYTAHDGLRLLGNALSPEMRVNGYPAQYFEKGRLEDHQGESSDPNWRFMYGLLVDELQQAQANMPIGGDTSTLTYAKLHTLADPGQRIEPPTGYPGQGVWRHTVADVFVPFTPDLRGGKGHLVLMGFWNYINRADLFPGGWLHDVGLPISEPQQVVVTKNLPSGPVQRLITVQAFQRTILTYDPLNPPDWRIERANVGSDYQKAFPERVGP